MQTQLHDMRRLTRKTLCLLCPDRTVGSPDSGPLRALKMASYHETESHALTRAIACIFMPLAQPRVMEVISFALTPSGPPICSMATYKSFLELPGHCKKQDWRARLNKACQDGCSQLQAQYRKRGAPGRTSSASLNAKLP